ncbi:beta-ketoacyl synthase, N-terminal domain protein [Mycobacterium kansasii]|uniref:Beta-ketoacyl synthase, N-terminal domain protein n=1 Tax=Mycobacterium kansasii TaxID=1768 RepID=A0A1V3X338_MYCKA|nr:beta-ketoacyl synthase, N-terminal domain protein [Mycobacterium kansasii]
MPLISVANRGDYLATRVAFQLGLRGPAINVQTACSSALVATHLAIQSLLSGECDMALAGAAAVHVPLACGYLHHSGGILSPSGRCLPFDADADGTVGGNGVGWWCSSGARMPSPPATPSGRSSPDRPSTMTAGTSPALLHPACGANAR